MNHYVFSKLKRPPTKEAPKVFSEQSCCVCLLGCLNHPKTIKPRLCACTTLFLKTVGTQRPAAGQTSFIAGADLQGGLGSRCQAVLQHVSADARPKCCVWWPKLVVPAMKRPALQLLRQNSFARGVPGDPCALGSPSRVLGVIVGYIS